MDLAARQPGLVNRMIRAARLEVPLYEEVEADLSATNQALLVVVIVAIAEGIGQALSGGNVVGRLVLGVLNSLIGWAVWSYVVYFVGTRFMGGTATYGELLRTLGFAETPGVLGILSFIPVLGPLAAVIGGIWTIVASFIGTRQALDIDNGKTVITIVLAIVALIIVVSIVSIIVGTIFGLGGLIGQAI